MVCPVSTDSVLHISFCRAIPAIIGGVFQLYLRGDESLPYRLWLPFNLGAGVSTVRYKESIGTMNIDRTKSKIHSGRIHEAAKTYAAIDLKSFYASVECMALGRNPMTTNLVVADKSRTDKTICLAVSPSLKSYGLPGRLRLFEVIQAVKGINAERRVRAPEGTFSYKSDDIETLLADPAAELDYIVAPPHMRKYMEVSRKIYSIYLRYVAPEDIFAYSIDEVFIDLTGYLRTYQMSGREMVAMMVKEVLKETGITATAGVGTNLYLAKVAMDIEAKHAEADADGVRIAELDEMTYRQKLWSHRPITDFWRVGRGYAKKLAANGMYTMGDIAMRSEDPDYGEPLLRKLFGVNAELLIDHAWGCEPVTMTHVKDSVPEDPRVS